MAPSRCSCNHQRVPVPTPPKITLATAGSLGDLHPFIALALALRNHGLQAEIASSPDYAAKVRAEGLVFHPVGPSQAELQAQMGMDAAHLTRRVAASNTFLFERLLLPHLEQGARSLIRVASDTSVIIGSPFAPGAAIAAEKLRVPFVPVVLQPAIVFSAYDPPRLPAAPWLSPAEGGFQLQLNRLTVALARASTARWTRPVDEVRSRFDLPPARRNLLLDGLCGQPLSIGMYSKLLGQKQLDAPAGFEVVGDAPYDSETGGPSAMPDALADFLAAGSSPIVFTLGSAAVNIAGNFYAEGLAAARRCGRRAVLLVGPLGDLSVANGDDAIALPYAPFSTLLPRAAAIVHQGGIGTTQQALRAGRPQLVVPHLGDQFDNAARVVRLGCGVTLSRRRYSSQHVAHALDLLLLDPEVRRTASRVGTIANRENGGTIAATMIAKLISG